MRIVIQRVKSAKVIIDNREYSSINNGLLCLVGFCDSDTFVDFEWATNKIKKIKIFNNSSLEHLGLDLMIVSQFTLFASLKKGNKPSWSKAASPELAEKLYNDFIQTCKNHILNPIKTGIFGADMQIDLINDGPFTLIIDTKRKE
ncbi:MAG: D-tyrosyl-tRNA(Tyr) deacylase [Flavobacteriales bacterium]|nr:D-tyrosyl-tRNA(Tyr) deacylase [Flavobacteriales bacterium]|tara:strand:- start:520 stop:954 length:435 start_codon:yes stop_codon:yes gene_type:complete